MYRSIRLSGFEHKWMPTGVAIVYFKWIKIYSLIIEFGGFSSHYTPLLPVAQAYFLQLLSLQEFIWLVDCDWFKGLISCTFTLLFTSLRSLSISSYVPTFQKYGATNGWQWRRLSGMKIIVLRPKRHQCSNNFLLSVPSVRRHNCYVKRNPPSAFCHPKGLFAASTSLFTLLQNLRSLVTLKSSPVI